jgi:hypothetical protein
LGISGRGTKAIRSASYRQADTLIDDEVKINIRYSLTVAIHINTRVALVLRLARGKGTVDVAIVSRSTIV